MVASGLPVVSPWLVRIVALITWSVFCSEYTFLSVRLLFFFLQKPTWSCPKIWNIHSELNHLELVWSFHTRYVSSMPLFWWFFLWSFSSLILSSCFLIWGFTRICHSASVGALARIFIDFRAWFYHACLKKTCNLYNRWLHFPAYMFESHFDRFFSIDLFP